MALEVFRFSSSRTITTELGASRSSRPNQEAEAAASSPHVLKVHYKYTVALQVEPGLSYTELLDLVCKKLELQPEHTKLRYKPAESQALVPLRTENLEAAWSQSKDNCLTVWCDVTEGEGFSPDSKLEESPQEATLEETGPTQVVAQYNYEATQPEDLEFQAGDVILVLSKVNEDWLEGQCNGKIGIFPSAFVQNCSSCTDRQKTQKSLRHKPVSVGGPFPRSPGRRRAGGESQLRARRNPEAGRSCTSGTVRLGPRRCRERDGEPG
ncbi:PREDICTED: neutrophil cytosol factor 2 [Phaethon lepturus]|uniref:neutrophil cytosol factor 2 n=1 Tax=Phaethon lepturus TaxID=97097 RepID=UPI000530AF27|nr:PREDICTED: neutrophil cytosol factor 2 [Phaethon lepturus]